MFSSTFIISPFIALLNQTLMVFMVRNVEHNSHILLMTGYEVRSCLLFSVCCCIGSRIYVGPGDRYVCLLHLLVMELGQTLTAKIHKYFRELRGVNR